MKIWGAKQAGNPVRVAIFVEEKGIDIPFEPVDLLNNAHKATDFLAKNPMAQVPVLELDDGTYISETVTICRYLERLHPNPPLLGKDPLDEARIDMWQRRIEFSLYGAARAVFRHSTPFMKKLEPVQIPAWADLNRPLILAALEMLEPQLKVHPFIAGPAFSVADITGVMALQMLDMMKIEIPAACRSVARWRDALLARPSVVAVSGARK